VFFNSAIQLRLPTISAPLFENFDHADRKVTGPWHLVLVIVGQAEAPNHFVDMGADRL
jgi:hypothetical protein